MRRFVFQADMDQLRPMLDAVRDFVNGGHIDQKKFNLFEMALEEVLVNVVHYAYPEASPGTVTLDMAWEKPGRLRLAIRDGGMAFNPLEMEIDLQTDRPIEDRDIGGLGIHLYKQICDSVQYERIGRENVLTLTKDLSV